MEELLTRSEVESLLSVRKSALYSWMRERDFPRPIKLSPRCVRWRRIEVEGWIQAQPRAEGDLEEVA